LLESAAIKRLAGEQLDEGIALNNLAELKLATNELATAEAYLNAAANWFRNTQALAQLKESLELRVQLNKLKRNPSQALAAMEELMVIKDSLLTKEKVESLLTMQVRYESEKKAQQIQLLEREDIIQKAKISAHKYWIGGLATTIILLATIVILVYVNFRLARRNKEHVETLLKELHHRVKNNLQLFSSIFSLQAQTLTDERAIQVVKTTEARINAMALIHRKLYNIDKNRTLSIKDYIAELLQYLTHAYGYQDKLLDICTNVSDVQVDVDKAIPLGLILNELISNAFKHAYEDQPRPELKIELQLSNEQLHIHLSDNGTGRSSTLNAEPGSFGLRMVNMLVRQLRGTIVTNTDVGTHYSLQIPVQ
jgi:two-component sensor histidine kinase